MSEHSSGIFHTVVMQLKRGRGEQNKSFELDFQKTKVILKDWIRKLDKWNSMKEKMGSKS